LQSNIKQLRKHHHISQRELGEAIGLSQQVVSRIERDRNKIQVDVLMNLADYFHVSTDYVLGYQRKPDRGGNFEKIPLVEAAADADHYAEIDKLEHMAPGEKWVLWNTLVYLKNIL
jgi:transcriptional regulator with XRE-family HTH domain